MTARHKLETLGAVLVPKEHLPWSLDELKFLDEQTSPNILTYKRASFGDTGEINPVSYFRILHPTMLETSLPDCFNLVNSSLVKKFFISLTGLENYDIDRCQVHMYSKGDFIDCHNDSESCPSYIYTIILILSDLYKGGEFFLYNKNNSLCLKPNKYSMIVANSLYSHEVKEITSGVRRALVFFLKSP